MANLEPDPSPAAGLTGLIFVPALLTLAVTVLRLVGELRHWAKVWFNPEAGGAWAVVGIVWLVPVVGIYFALRLSAAGQGPARPGRAVGSALVGSVVFAGGFLLFQQLMTNLEGIVLMWALAVCGAALQWPAWSPLFKTLAAYGFAARIPVALVMALATWANWKSHYSTLQPGESKLGTYFLFGFFPQLAWWVSFTVVAGSLFGTVAVVLARRGKPASKVAG